MIYTNPISLPFIQNLHQRTQIQTQTPNPTQSRHETIDTLLDQPIKALVLQWCPESKYISQFLALLYKTMTVFETASPTLDYAHCNSLLGHFHPAQAKPCQHVFPENGITCYWICHEKTYAPAGQGTRNPHQKQASIPNPGQSQKAAIGGRANIMPQEIP